MVAIIIISAVIRDLFKKKIETSRIQKTVIFSLLKEYKCQLLEKWNLMKEQSNGQQQSTKAKTAGTGHRVE